MQHANHWQSSSAAGKFWQRVLTAPASLNIEPPPKIPSILPTLRPLFKFFFLSVFFFLGARAGQTEVDSWIV